MKSFSGRLAVVTGGGTGMGRALVVQLAAEGCSVAMCDINSDNMAEAVTEAAATAAPGVQLTTHVADVSSEEQMLHFRDEVVAQHQRDHINLLFNNAGIVGPGSFLNDAREAWDKQFAVCWGGVYNGMRAFADLLVASDEGYVVNTSSAMALWAWRGPGQPDTAYCAAKFAVKGFTEALIEDFRLHAPHVKVAVVMPGRVLSDIGKNSRDYLGAEAHDFAESQAQMASGSVAPERFSEDEFLTTLLTQMAEMQPLTEAEAAKIILDAVHAGEWRILVGDDVRAIDEATRGDPLVAYGPVER